MEEVEEEQEEVEEEVVVGKQREGRGGWGGRG